MNKVGGIDVNDIRAAYGGMSIPIQTAETNVMTSYRGNTYQEWTYLKPRGGSNSPEEPYRLGDFRNYEHAAQRFYDIVIPDKIFGETNPVVGISINMNTNANWIGWTDLQLDNYYFGAIVVLKNGTTPYNKAITTQTLSQMSESPYVEVEIPSPVIDSEYEVFSFLSESINAPFLMLEYGSGITTYKSVMSVTLTAYWDVSYTTVNWSLVFTNNTGASITMIGGYLYARYGDNALTDQQQTGEQYQTLTTPLTIPSSGLSLSGSWSSILPNYSTRGGYVYFGNSSFPSINQQQTLYDPI